MILVDINIKIRILKCSRDDIYVRCEEINFEKEIEKLRG